MLVTQFNVPFPNLTKNSGHPLRTSSFIGLGANTQCGDRDFLSMRKNFKDLTGRAFGKLTVIELGSRKSKNGSLYWLCKCECGAIKEIRGDGIVSKKVISCGCSKIDGMRVRFFRHGKTRTKAYGSWGEMNTRCFNKSEEQYKDYGGRGITVCGNYEPSNCKWATRKEQQRNRRNNVWLEAFGEKKILKDWAIYLDVNTQTIKYHLNKNISMEEIYTYVTNPLKFKRRMR